MRPRTSVTKAIHPRSVEADVQETRKTPMPSRSSRDWRPRARRNGVALGARGVPARRRRAVRGRGGTDVAGERARRERSRAERRPARRPAAARSAAAGSHPEGAERRRSSTSSRGIRRSTGPRHLPAGHLAPAPAICRFTSEVFYESRLRPLDGLERQVISGAGTLRRRRLCAFVEVDHDRLPQCVGRGSRASSPSS